MWTPKNIRIITLALILCRLPRCTIVSLSKVIYHFGIQIEVFDRSLLVQIHVILIDVQIVLHQFLLLNGRLLVNELVVALSRWSSCTRHSSCPLNLCSWPNLFRYVAIIVGRLSLNILFERLRFHIII